MYSWDYMFFHLGGGVLSVPFGLYLSGSFGGAALLLLTGIQGELGNGAGCGGSEHFYPDVGTEEFKIFSI